MFKRFFPIFFLFLFVCGTFSQAQKIYKKNYDSNRKLISEGWQKSGEKTGYWKFYFSNGKKKSEGHYCNGLRCKYWYFYLNNGKKKAQGHYKNGLKTNWWVSYNGEEKSHTEYENNKKNGFSFLYKKNKLYKAEKYENDKKLKEWTDVESFKRDNS